MNNLNFEELKALSVSVADNALLERISGGTADDCHDNGDFCYEHGHGHPKGMSSDACQGPQ